MNILNPYGRLAPRLLIACAVLTFAGCASAPWDGLFSDAQPSRAPVLLAPAPVSAGYYRVNPGDTLASVAASFGRELAQIARWNGVSTDYAVSVGQVLRVAPLGAEQAALPPAPAQSGVPLPNAVAASATPPVPAPQTARFVWPASGPVTLNFDEGQSRAIHIGGSAGETIKAASAGRVIYAGSQIKAYGLLVIVKHDKRFVSAYGNNARVLVKEGDAVKQGQPIAEMGAADDPHPYLIFELRDSAKAVDPQSYLPKRAS
ncbi:peptidoglycan DD-metalloendopeptidase family protein [Paraburkholderia sp. C35]|uniref:peptidoglycan DD-metalloendopeptidase family protein n=1 Tax=Paraburkholderia sp. C35 TaxID=2126993 RepID=UPI000D69373D|nr:peptidoglycan DD-metalloendopeptidase family protein [Paraburkholderia sp. C35]